MQRLVYSSHRYDDTDANGFSSEFVQIACEALEHNPKIGLTGFLICAPKWFCQILEGEPAAIDKLVKKLVKDKRHHNFLVLDRIQTEARVFPNWDMGWQHQSIANRIKFLECELVQEKQPIATQLNDVLALADKLAKTPPA